MLRGLLGIGALLGAGMQPMSGLLAAGPVELTVERVGFSSSNWPSIGVINYGHTLSNWPHVVPLTCLLKYCFAILSLF